RCDLGEDPLDGGGVPAAPLVVLRGAQYVDQPELVSAREDRRLERYVEEVEHRRQGLARPGDEIFVGELMDALLRPQGIERREDGLVRGEPLRGADLLERGVREPTPAGRQEEAPPLPFVASNVEGLGEAVALVASAGLPALDEGRDRGAAVAAEEDEAGIREEYPQEGNAETVLGRLLEQTDRFGAPAPPHGCPQAYHRVVQPATATGVTPVLLRAPESAGLRAPFELGAQVVGRVRVEVLADERVRLPAAEAGMKGALEHLVALIGERPEPGRARERLEQHARPRARGAEDDDRIPDHAGPATRRSRANAGAPRCEPRPPPISTRSRFPSRPPARRSPGAGEGAGSPD